MKEENNELHVCIDNHHASKNFVSMALTMIHGYTTILFYDSWFR
jgi:hypothetical protein